MPLPWRAAFSRSDHSLQRSPIVSNTRTWIRFKLLYACLVGIWEGLGNKSMIWGFSVSVDGLGQDLRMLSFMDDSPTYTKKYLVVKSSWPSNRCHECSSLAPVGSKRHFQWLMFVCSYGPKNHYQIHRRQKKAEAEPRDTASPCCEMTFWRIENHFRSHFSPFQINTQLFFFFNLFTKWPPAAILDDRKSLSIAFLAISDQYATFLYRVHKLFHHIFLRVLPL